MNKFAHNLRYHRFTVALVAMFLTLFVQLKLVAALTAQVAYNLLAVARIPRMQLSLGLTAEEETRNANAEILKHLGQLGDRFKKFDGVAEEMKLMKEDQAKTQTALTDMQKTMLAYQKHQLALAGPGRRSHDGISEACARFLGGVYLAGAVEQAGAQMRSSVRDLYRNEIKSILGYDIESKAALTSADIPLPIGYSGDVAELVYSYGIARRVGTVLPIGAASFKTQKLTSSPTFTLIAGSGTVPEKSPQTAWVTFNPEKFGGLIRMPSELEEDSILGIGQFLARYAARQMAQVEDYNFFRSTGAASGQDGTGEGLTKSVVTDTKFVYNGGTSTSGKTKQSDATLADFRALRTVPNGAVLGRAKYAMHPTYEALLVSYNGATNGTVYIRGSATAPATLDGFEIVWVPDMPAYSTAAAVSLVHVLFGDFTYNYLGLRGNMRFDTSREAGFTTDEVLVRALERFTIGKMATDCVAGLRNSAS